MGAAAKRMRSGSPALGKILGWAGLLSFFAFLCFLMAKTPGPVEEAPGFIQSREYGKDVASGLEIADYLDGQKRFVIRIDRLRVVKKKVGFLALGFMKIALLDGVSIQWHERDQSPSPANASSPVAVPAFRPVPEVPVGPQPLFARIDQLKKRLPGHVRGVEFARVTIHYFKNKEHVSLIVADKARGGRQKKHLVFMGNVRITGGNGRALACDRITWQPRTGRLVTSESYAIRYKNKRIRGQGLETDPGLRDIIFKGRRTQ